LADAEAYRRDRRKDALLQQNGYFVLRFLAEDLGKHLDYVLDTVFGALAHRGIEVKAQPPSDGTEKTPVTYGQAMEVHLEETEKLTAFPR
jgi:hypothetical protein